MQIQSVLPGKREGVRGPYFGPIVPTFPQRWGSNSLPFVGGTPKRVFCLVKTQNYRQISPVQVKWANETTGARSGEKFCLIRTEISLLEYFLFRSLKPRFLNYTCPGSPKQREGVGAPYFGEN